MKQPHFLWSIIIAALCGIIYVCWGVFTPFIVALVIAYLWSPIATLAVKKLNMKRWVIALILIAVTVGILLTVVVLLLPLIYHQVLDFIALAPHYKKFIEKTVTPVLVEKFGAIAPEYVDHIKMSMSNLFGSGFHSIAGFIKKVWASGFVVVDLLWFILLVPFIAFHLMKDWDILVFSVKNAVPIERQTAVQQFFTEVDHVISGVIRGQFNVCVIWAIYYTTMLTIIGLNHSIFIGVTTGLVNFIPFVGIFVASTSAMVVAYLQTGSIEFVALVATVFMIGSVCDTGFVSPKLIGRRVGIHSVWSIFAIVLGARLFGFIGMLIAIPVGATIGVIIKMILKYYYKSALYSSKKRVKAKAK